ncbi:hypothetical protein [Aureliella helgolandensis]|uniref:Uncharacterized protein n=1 Tax=Aureliella helgolandensis TaxID=2527968 RepID=A0A518G0F8_9BACT|nr:hypothetical protein [Aureliella helgolandensis]QDV22083.1 hypothetical protein Q31a_03620 [Aureliella helgolandensis]
MELENGAPVGGVENASCGSGTNSIRKARSLPRRERYATTEGWMHPQDDCTVETSSAGEIPNRSSGQHAYMGSPENSTPRSIVWGAFDAAAEWKDAAFACAGTRSVTAIVDAGPQPAAKTNPIVANCFALMK